MLHYSNKGSGTKSRHSVMWRIVQSPPSSVRLIFGLSTSSTQEAVGVSNEHHDFPLLGNFPAHHHALRFPEQLMCSPAEFKDPRRVKHPSKLEQGLSTMAHISRVCQGLCVPCASCAVKRAMPCGRPRPPNLPYGKAHLHRPLQPHHMWYGHRLRRVPLASSPQIMPWVRQLELTCHFPPGMSNSNARRQWGTRDNGGA